MSRSIQTEQHLLESEQQDSGVTMETNTTQQVECIWEY